LRAAGKDLEKPVIRRSPRSRYSSLLMIALGIITYFVVNHLLGAALVIIGFVMYAVYLRLSESSQKRAQSGAAPASISPA
jgi:hypothetical protein